MRYIVDGMMGVGTILFAFGSVIVVLELFASRADSGHGLREMTALAAASLVVGGALLALGFVLGRLARKSHLSAP